MSVLVRAFWYGPYCHYRQKLFLGTGIALFATCSRVRSVHSFDSVDAFYYRPLLCVLSNPVRTCANLFRHSFTDNTGAGISACFPSTTPFGLALGPDLPREDEPSPGILSQSVCGILTHISLLTPAFSLPYAPVLLSVYLQCCMERSPTTYVYTQIHRFGTALSPG